MIDWWSDTDRAILTCLETTGPMSPEALCRDVGLSEGEMAAFLTMLVRDGRVRIRLVGLAEDHVTVRGTSRDQGGR